MNLKVYQSSNQEFKKSSKENLTLNSHLSSKIGTVTDFHKTSNSPDQQDILVQKNSSLKYVLYWNEAYGDRGEILTLSFPQNQMLFGSVHNTHYKVM